MHAGVGGGSVQLRFFPFNRSMWRTKSVANRILCCIFLLAIIVIFMFLLTISSTSFRNCVLSNFLPHTWLTISSDRLMRMSAVNMNVGKCPTSCPSLYHHPVSRKEVVYEGAKFYTDKRFETISYHSDQGNFLPLLTKEEKIDALYSLEVMAAAMAKSGLDFFLVDGTLLGLVRNHAMIPWDDDIDVAMNGTQWKQIRDTLCCVKGFTLRMKGNMHWRFFMDDAMIVGRTPDIRFPFVDMFLYTEDDEWIWSMTSYNIQNLAFPKTDIFPLTSTEFEGRKYPIPRRPNKVIRKQFGNLDDCISAGMFHKYNHPVLNDEKSRISCSKLKGMYNFYDGLDGFP